MQMPEHSAEIQSDWRKFQERTEKIRREWEHFMKTGKVQAEDVLSPEVLSSWIRCRNRGLDPYHIPNVGLTERELNSRLEENRILIDVISPFLQAITESIQGTGFKIDIFDKDLYLLKHFGDQEVLDNFECLKAGPGVSRCEVHSGTNAMNLVTILEKPVQLVGPEHYSADLHIYTCTSVPIKSEDGKLIAVINAVGNYWLMHRHTLGMMIALGKSIEYSLFQRRIRKESEITSKLNKEIIEAMGDALIVVDENGKIKVANRVAQELLADTRAKNIIGYAAEELWGKRNPFTEVLTTGDPFIEREILLDTGREKVRLIGTIRPISSDRTDEQGVIGTFKGLNNARGMVKNFAGWKAHFTFESLIGESTEIRQAIRLARETAKMQCNILIQGESGTGKELFAQAIHNASPNYQGPFIVVNCAAIPNGLLESELFGYERGAFTGAKKEGQSGKFELAYGGTILLDEINSLPIDMQAKILRTLQNKTVVRVGGSEEIPVNVRIIAAGNTDLWQMVESGEFREDLFYRINVITIYVPPLRERGNDIELLIGFITEQLAKRLGLHLMIEKSAIELMKKYHWPGNIRELENVLERGYVIAKTRGSKVVTVDDIRNYLGIKLFLQRNNPRGIQPLTYDKRNIYVLGLKDMEREALLKALTANNGNITLTAQSLGVARNTIYRKIKRYGIKKIGEVTLHN